MEVWLKSNLILMLLTVPIVSYLTVNSVERISSFGLYGLAKPSLITFQKRANDFTYEVKLRAAADSAIAEANVAAPQ
ncbi:hypothetical protein IFO70_10815 [Phormidium tenue FACHB-886]|nr:hypothetical protein [Phormidium tenue FACHB-886]